MTIADDRWLQLLDDVVNPTPLFVMPISDPTDGDLAKIDLATLSTLIGGQPGGSDTYVQYNDGGDLAGEVGFAWDKTAKRLTIKTSDTGKAEYADSLLTLESNTDHISLEILTTTSKAGIIRFSDLLGSNGGIQYNHATDQMDIKAGGVWGYVQTANSITLGSASTHATTVNRQLVVAGQVADDSTIVRIQGTNLQTGDYLHINDYGQSGGTILNIDQDGKVGINVDPDYLFHVKDDAYTPAYNIAFHSGMLDLFRDTAGAGQGIRFSRGLPNSTAVKWAFTESGGAYYMTLGDKDGAAYIRDYVYGSVGTKTDWYNGYPNAGASVDGTLGKITVNQQDAAEVGYVQTGVNLQTADYININSFGNTGGDVFKVDATGTVTITGTIATSAATNFVIDSGKNIIARPDTGYAFDIQNAGGSLSLLTVNETITTLGTNLVLKSNNTTTGSYPFEFTTLGTRQGGVTLADLDGRPYLDMWSGSGNGPTVRMSPTTTRAAAGSTITTLQTGGSYFFMVGDKDTSRRLEICTGGVLNGQHRWLTDGGVNQTMHLGVNGNWWTALQDAAEIGWTLTGADTQTGDYVNINSFGNTGGDVFSIDSAGKVTIYDTIETRDDDAAVMKLKSHAKQLSYNYDEAAFVLQAYGGRNATAYPVFAIQGDDNADGTLDNNIFAVTWGTGAGGQVYASGYNMGLLNGSISGQMYAGGGNLNFNNPSGGGIEFEISGTVGMRVGTSRQVTIGDTATGGTLYVKAVYGTAPVCRLETYSGHSGNAFEINTSGVTGGDLFYVDVAGITHLKNDTQNALYFGAGDDVSMGWLDSLGWFEIDCTKNTTDKDLVVNCGTTKTLKLSDPCFDDYKFTPSDCVFGGTNDPTKISWQPGSTITFYVYGFDVDDEMFYTLHLTQRYAEGEDLRIRLHWTPGPNGVGESGSNVGWKADITRANVGGTFGNATGYTLTDAVTGTDEYHERTADVVIDGTDFLIDDILVIRIHRSDTGSDDTWSGVGTDLPILLSANIQVPVDTMGSRTNTSK